MRFHPVAQALAMDLMLVTRKVLRRREAYLALPEAERERQETFAFLRHRWTRN